MKKVSIFILLIVAFLLYIIMSNSNQKKYSVSADTNVSQIKGLSKYVSQEEVNDFGMRYSDIAKDKEKNATLMPLRVALENKDTNKVLSFLKDNNLSVDVRMLAKRTPLMYSTFHNDANTTKELLKLNADFNTTDRYKISPLSYAISNNSIETVKQLIANGARFEDVKFVQGYLTTNSYGRIKYLEIDEKNITKIYYLDNNVSATTRKKSKDAADFFRYIVAVNLVEMTKIVLEDGYKPKLGTGIGSLPGLHNDAPKETSPFAYTIVLKPNYKPMLKLCLKYVGKPSQEHLKKAYKQCHWGYENQKNKIKFRNERPEYKHLVTENSIDKLNSYTKHCSNKDGEFTPETYFAWANESRRLSRISSFKQEHKDKVFYINSNSNNTNKKKD